MPRLIIGLLALLLSLAFHAASAQQRPVVTIDAGHGGEQAGVVIGDIIEKDVVLRAAFAFAEEFAARGYDVHLTRTGDETIGFQERTDMAEAAGSFLMISLHTNRSDADSVHGMVIFTDLENTRTTDVASAVADAVRETGSRVTVVGRDAGFLKSETVAVLMMEMGYLSHPVERRLVLSSDYHHELGAKIAEAMKEVASRLD